MNNKSACSTSIIAAVAVLLAVLSAVAAQQGPVTSGFRIVSLNSGSSSLSAPWTFAARNGSILKQPATVPGEVYTDLMRQNLIDDPLYRFNDVATQWVSLTNWTYTTYFNLDQAPDVPRELVFEALTTIADVYVNGQLVGIARDAFQRRVFSLAGVSLTLESNELKVVFSSAIEYGNKKWREYPADKKTGQKPLAPGYIGGFTVPPAALPPGQTGPLSSRNFVRMAQSYSGWDWGFAAASTGITRDVYLRVYSLYTMDNKKTKMMNNNNEKKRKPLLSRLSSKGDEEIILPYSIDYVVPRTYPLPYMKNRVKEPLQDFNNSFLLVCDVHFSCVSTVGVTCFRDGSALSVAVPALNARGIATVFEPTGPPCTAPGQICKAVATVNVTANNAHLWWPVGMQDNASNVGRLYELDIGLLSSKQVLIAKAQRNIGFRSVELISKGDPLNYGLPPSRQRPDKPVLFFRINGIPLFVKGSNFVPFDNFEERVNSTLRQYVLRSAVDAGMNLLRVWGGGLYMQDAFYDWCDEHGLLIWSEQRFACSPYPDDAAFLSLVRNELAHQVKRLSSHPSVLVWSGNNEDMQPYGTTAAYKKLNYDTVIATLVAHDDSRPVLPASPSCGWSSGFTGAGLPLGPVFAPAPFSATPWPASGPACKSRDTHYYNYAQCGVSSADTPALFPDTSFASEFGFQSLPLMQQWKQVSAPDGSDSTFYSALMVHRQHHPQGQAEMADLITQNFNIPHGFFDNRSQFQRAIYLSQVQQTLCIAGEAMYYRRARDMPQRTMGSLYWQLNTVWQAPSWSSLERSVDPAEGINGGAWKLLHYAMAAAYQKVLLVPYTNNTHQPPQVQLNILTDLLGTSTKYKLYCVSGIKIYLYPSQMSAPPSTPDEYFWDRARGVFFEPLRGNVGWKRNLSDFAAAPQCGGSLSGCIVVLESTCSAELQELNPLPSFFVLAPWKSIALAPSTVAVALQAATATSISVVITASAISPFVYLSAPSPFNSMGRWSHNGFLVIPGTPVTASFTCLKYDGSWCDLSSVNPQHFVANTKVEKLNE